MPRNIRFGLVEVDVNRPDLFVTCSPAKLLGLQFYNILALVHSNRPEAYSVMFSELVR